MPHTTADGPKIYYEASGDPAHEPIVLLEGFSAQLIGWRKGFVDRLGAEKLFVICPDNRDVGLSEKMGGPVALTASYEAADMAGDVCRVLESLGLGSANILGQSMGGVIAQTMAIEHPEKARSLVLLYTMPAYNDEFMNLEALSRLSDTDWVGPATREENIEARVATVSAALGQTEFPVDIDWVLELAELSFDRCYRPDGLARQADMLRRSGDRRKALKTLAVPTSIIHGLRDGAVRPEAAITLATLIQEAELHLYAGMGHYVAEPLWDEFASVIRRCVDRGVRARASR